MKGSFWNLLTSLKQQKRHYYILLIFHQQTSLLTEIFKHIKDVKDNKGANQQSYLQLLMESESYRNYSKHDQGQYTVLANKMWH